MESANKICEEDESVDSEEITSSSNDSDESESDDVLSNSE